MKMKKRRLAMTLAAISLCLAAAYGYSIASAAELSEGDLYNVAYVNDGDTFVVRDERAHEYTVRLLGIDTPEAVDPRKPVQCYGPEASAATKSLLEGRKVRLEKSPKREERDKYGRYLRYAYRDDGLPINEYLIQNGFAREYTYGKAYSKQASFKAIEKAAARRHAGLWSKCSQG